MKKFNIFFFTLLSLVLFLCSCATVPPKTTQPSIWPPQSDYKLLYYVPQKMSSADEAIGTIKNLQRNFVEWGAGMYFSSLEVDPYGMRAKWQWTETSQQTTYVPTYGGMFLGWDYIPTYSGTYQTQTSTEQKDDMFLIPFNEVRNLSLYHMPNLPRNFKWGLIVELENNRRVNLRVSDENYLLKLVNAIATLSMERGFNYLKFWFGCSVQKLTLPQSQNLGLPADNGLLVFALARDSSAEKSGIQFLDVLLEFDNVPLKTYEDFRGAVNNAYGSGKKVVPVKIIRREKVTNLVIDPKTQKVLKTEVTEQKVEKIIDANLLY